MRRLPFIAALIGVALLASGALAARSASSSTDAQRSALRSDSVHISGQFQAYFERAASLDLLLAQNPSFVAFYREHHADRSLLARSGPVVAAMNDALRYLEVLYPGSIGEACFIDDQGREIARVVNARVAPYGDLSTTEAANPFFTPTRALPVGVVYQAAPYVSADTHAWVISNSTPIAPAPGEQALVHFEVSLDSFRQYLGNADDPHRHAAVVDRRTGEVVLSSDTPLGSAASPGPGDAATSWSRKLVGVSAQTGDLPVGGHNGTYQRIAPSAGNANDWYVVNWTTADPGVLPTWAGGLFIAVGLALLLTALGSFRQQHRALRAAARLDGLTGLGNRQAVNDALQRAMVQRAIADGERFGVLVLDLDGFKQVNDVFGHHRGDQVLKEVARRLHANVFEYDTPGRLGGDEFAVVLRKLDGADGALSVANRLREALSRPIELDGTPHFVGVSVGAAVFPDHGSTPDELIRSADAAMYSAKRERTAPQLYRPGTMAGAGDLEHAAELLAAIDHDEIVLHYQSEVSMSTGSVVAVEALARWQHPERGLLAPSTFIPLAERVGLIRPLTMHVLRLALRQIRIWREAEPTAAVSVNLSAKLLADPSIVNDICRALTDADVPASALVIEVTETALVTDPEAAAELLTRLRSLGIRVEVDDFGSGYASFGYLRDLPLDGVKLDREFINHQLTDGDATGLLKATIETCHSVGLQVIAEGIEEQAVYDTLRRLGCDVAQGFLIGRPTPATDMLGIRRAPQTGTYRPH
jgi:diguanylate cyclase (GGDEF)-like protein